jgi:hypothetical protein
MQGSLERWKGALTHATGNFAVRLQDTVDISLRNDTVDISLRNDTVDISLCEMQQETRFHGRSEWIMVQ